MRASKNFRLRYGALTLILAAGLALNACKLFAADEAPAKTPGWDDVPAILAKIVAPAFPDKDFPITDFGATDKNAKPAIDKAIEACHEAGGGRVLIPAGDWFVKGPIHLKSNVNLNLAKDATVRFSTDTADFPVVFTRFESTEVMNYSPLLYAFEQENIAITGEGVFDGQGSYDNWWGMKNQKADVTALREMGNKGVPVEERVFGPGHRLRPNFVQPYRCKNILIEGVTFKDSPMWFINPVLCTNVTVGGVTTVGHGPNNDGCNPECTKYVLIEDCYFNTGDDCIAIKSGRDADGRRVNVPSENIVIRNCEMKDGHGGVVMGSEMTGGIRNVFAENCKMDSPDLERALRIKSNSWRGGFAENVYFRNVEVGQVSDAIFRINMYYAKDRGENYPHISNINMENVTVKKAPVALYLHGVPQLPINGVTIRNCKFDGVKNPDVLCNVEGLTILGTKINGLPKQAQVGTAAGGQ